MGSANPLKCTAVVPLPRRACALNAPHKDQGTGKGNMQGEIFPSCGFHQATIGMILERDASATRVYLHFEAARGPFAHRIAPLQAFNALSALHSIMAGMPVRLVSHREQ